MTEPTTRSQQLNVSLYPQAHATLGLLYPSCLEHHPPYVSVFLSEPFSTLVEVLSYYYTRGRDIVIVSGHS